MKNLEIAAGPRALMLAATLMVCFGCASGAARATPTAASLVATPQAQTRPMRRRPRNGRLSRCARFRTRLS